jgi:hypothetical protein
MWPLSFVRHRRTTPELEYPLASWGSRMPYRRAAELQGELLPIQEREVVSAGTLLPLAVSWMNEWSSPTSTTSLTISDSRSQCTIG